MEKKIVCIKEFPDGEQHVNSLEDAIKERVDWKIALLLKQYCDMEVTVRSEFLVNVKGGEINSMLLAFTMENAKDEDDTDALEIACNGFFNLDFERRSVGSVRFFAENVYEMALLTHALTFATVWIGYSFMPVDINMSVSEAREMVRKREEDARRRAEEDEIECDYEEPIYDLDKYHVAYSKDGKKLLFAKAQFEDPVYRVPDGVEEISDYAFLWCQIPVRLLVPRSVKRIGNDIFGVHGGHIEMV